jgi:hypothetical protein
MDACCVRCFDTGRNVGSGRRSRVVLVPRSWRYVGGNPPATGARKAASPGRVRISRKTIARGKPGCLGCTCQTRVLCCAVFCTRRCGRSRRPAFPAPSVRERDDELAQPGRKPAAGNEPIGHFAKSISELDSPRPACGERSTRVSAAGEGDSPRVLFGSGYADAAPHPNPLPAWSGERERDSARSFTSAAPPRAPSPWPAWRSAPRRR